MNAPLLIWTVAGLLFLAGFACLILRRQLIALILGIELMINAANVALVYCAVQRQDAKGLAVALLIIAAAAAEAVVGLALILALNQEQGASETGEIRELAG